MIYEKFDLIECLRLAIANGGNKGSNMTKDIVLGELALLSPAAAMWAGLLLRGVELERIAIITPSEAQYEHRRSVYDWQYEWDRFLSVIPGIVEFVRGPAKSADYYRVRNVLAKEIERAMIKNKFNPVNCRGQLDKVAKGLAEVVLKGHIFSKGMCAPCAGVGKFETFKDGKQDNIKRCERCDGTGKIPYTLKEKISIAGLTVSKSGYVERYAQYELIAESSIAEWNNQIRDRLARSFYYKDAPTTA